MRFGPTPPHLSEPHVRQDQVRPISVPPVSRAFLATTALEDFWDTSKPVLFLSEGCRQYSRRSVWEALDGRVLKTPWRSEHEVHDAYGFTAGVYERLLPSLAQALNAAHGRRHDLRYWRIVLGPWLNRYIHVVYDRYRLIQAALNAEPGLTTIGLAERCFVTPRDTNDFELQVLDDPYNLQLCTKIMAALDLDFPRKEARAVPYPPSPLAHFSIDRNLPRKASLKRLARSWYQTVLEVGQRNRPIILKSAYFPWIVQAQLSIETIGRTWLNETPLLPDAPAAVSLDGKLRHGLYTASIRSEFDHILSRLLPEDLPRCFAEDYGRVEAYARAHYPAAPRAIFSANAWYCDEAFKHWAGSCAEEGTQLLGTQHGGYGTQHYKIQVDHELEIMDRYYTWGWERSGTRAVTIALPGCKLMGRKPLPADNGRAGFLFVMTTAPRFLLEFPYSPDQHHDYLRWQKLFVESLDPRLHGEMRARPHSMDCGWDMAKRWKDYFPHITLETWDKPLWESLVDCRLFVTDHASTTYLEALAVGKPTILFWKPDTSINRLHPDAQEYFDELRAVGVFYDAPQAAAQAVGQIYWDVETWWNEPHRQAAVDRFRQRFARTSDDALALWTSEFIRIADTSQMNSPIQPHYPTTRETLD